MKKIKGSITSPKGFLAAGISAGIKKSGKKDLAIIFSQVPAAAAGVFTTNKFKAAPVIVSEKQISSGVAQAIVANSGLANAATGKQGIKDAWKMVEVAAKALGIKDQHVLVTSTGSIGRLLPMEKVVPAINRSAGLLSKAGGRDVSQAILTTDTRVKEVCLKAGKYTISGTAKGSGMINPNMATMHAFITTDAAVNSSLLKKLLKQAVDVSFNMLSVDNCMSTNDCVMVLANGMSGVEIKGAEIKRFKKALEYICVYLAKEIARDGEGATQLMTIKVTGAKSVADARIAAKAIVNSDLLKCAVYGRDHNLGRIYAAIGASSAKMNIDKVKAGMQFGKNETIITCDLGAGSAAAEAWGCDLTEGYIKINARYHT